MSAANSFATAIQPSEEAFGLNRKTPTPVANTGPGVFEGYGYQPTGLINMMQPMPMTAPEGGIVDPSYLAQLAVLNQPQVMSAQFQPMGSGLIDGSAGMGKGGSNLMVPNYRPMAQQFRQDLANIYNASAGGGDGGQIAFNPNQDFGYFSGVTPTVNYGIPVSDALVGTVNSDGSVSYSPTVSPVTDYGPVVGTPLGPVGGGGGGGFDGTSSGPFGGISEGFDGSPSAPSANDGAQEGFDGSPGDGGGGGGGGKIICTAMNHAYGFGGFRQGIWLRYSAQHMTKAHEVGYHSLFLPLVHAAYHQDKWYSKTIRKVLEHGTRHRTADLRAEMRGTKRDTLGRFYRSIFEPLCYAVGKLKGY